MQTIYNGSDIFKKKKKGYINQKRNVY